MRLFVLWLIIAASLPGQTTPDPGALSQQARDIVLQPGGRQEAENLLKQAIAGYEKAASKSDEYAAALTLLALIRNPELKNDKDLLASQVEPLVRQAIELRQTNPATRSSDLALDLELEAMILEELGRLDDSRDPKAKARAIRDQIIIGMQPPPDDFTRVEHMGDAINPPRLISRLEPEPSFEARVLKLAADILIEIVIGTDGTIAHVEIYRPAGFGLDEKAVECLLKWRFLPGQKNGTPVPVEGTLRLRFQPPGAPPPPLPPR